MGGLITKEERDRRIGKVLSFIFLFRYVTAKDLNLLGSTLLDVNDMRRTIKYFLSNKLIKAFDISDPVKTTGFYLTEDGLAKVPKALLEYKYSFWPARYRPGTFFHDSGVIGAFLGIQNGATKGRWISEWMIRQDHVKARGRAGRGLGLRHKSVLRGRLPDGMFVIGQKARIAVEYEDVRRNVTAWVEIIRDLEYRMKAKVSIDLPAKDGGTGSDFEAVLFVFGDKATFSIYCKRFDECLKFGKVGGQEIKEAVNPKRFFFTTLDELKEGKLYRAGGEENSFKELFSFVESDGNPLRGVTGPGRNPHKTGVDQYTLNF
jgi:hypothetical protein